jgi:hypothetical protein
MRISLGAEHGREAYYQFTTARVELTYTFVPRVHERGDLY